MSSPGQAQLSQFVSDEIVGGVVADIILLNPWNDAVPFTAYTGDGVTVNRELALGDVQLASVGDTIVATNPSSVTSVTFRAGKIIGASEVDYLVQAESTSSAVSMQAIELRSKAKSIGLTYQSQVAGGDGVPPNLNSLPSLVDAAQYTTATGGPGQPLSFGLMDELADLVTAKQGQVDFFVGPPIALRQFKQLYRDLGGAAPVDVIEIPGTNETRQVLTYEGIRFYRNDHLSTTEQVNGTSLTGGAFYSIYAGCWDDGTRRIGVSNIYPSGQPAGIQISPPFVHPDRDEEVVRVKAYWNFVNFNRRGLARLTSLTT